MNYVVCLEEFFKKNKQCYTLDVLLQKFKITEKFYSDFCSALYELERSGKIYFDEKTQTYMHVAEDFYLMHGILQISNKKKYYIDLKGGNRIMIPSNTINAQPKDAVFVQKHQKRLTKYAKYQTEDIVRVVSMPKGKDCEQYFYKTKIKKNSANETYYFRMESDRIEILPEYLNGSFPGDLVTLQITKRVESIHPTAKVIDILKRKNKNHIFEYHKGKWIPTSTAYFKVEINDSKEYQEGDVILASVPLKPDNGIYRIKPISRLKNTNSISNKIEIMALEKGFSKEFSEKELREIEDLPMEIPMEERYLRRDLRNLVTFTIDPSTAKDLDDAVSLETFHDYYRLYVHIADVDYYVRPGSILFNGAIKRGNTGYFSNFVFPMLHPKISNCLCSLNPLEQKLTKTIMMEIDKEGNLHDFQVFPSITQSNCKMNYDKVDEILNEESVDLKYQPYTRNLLDMNKLSQILQKRRLKRGFICLSNNEIQIDVDENGLPIRLVKQVESLSHLMIENFMLYANETLTEYGYWLGLPLVYRNHEPPSIDKTMRLSASLSNISKKYRRLGNITEPQLLQRILLSLCENKCSQEIQYISNIFLHAMSRAYYSNENKGHFGLALNRYATFTSPIRKSSDLLNHTCLSKIIRSNNVPSSKKYNVQLSEICKHLSERQKTSDELEQDVSYYLLNVYSNQYYNQEMEAEIMFLMENEIFLKTSQDLCGFVSLNSNFYYDRITNTVKDYRNHVLYRIGDCVKVKLIPGENKDKKIKFELLGKMSLEKENVKKYQKKIEYY